MKYERRVTPFSVLAYLLLSALLSASFTGCLRRSEDVKSAISRGEDIKSAISCDDHELSSGVECAPNLVDVDDQGQEPPPPPPPSCGEGGALETCDQGVACEGDECQEGRCGDGVLNSGEQCDDGNTEAERCAYGERECVICAEGCQERLGELTGFCGDGVQQAQEGCDDGNSDTERCAYGEAECLVCASDCQEQRGELTGRCGDGVKQAQEGCDDGNQESDDGCSRVCTPEEGYRCTQDPPECQPICGDGLLTADEVCDDGNAEEGDYCAADCRAVTGSCGDLIVQSNEPCDGEPWCSERCTGLEPPCFSTAAGCPVIDFVLIQGGSFEMGAVGVSIDEEPVHTVTIPSFELSRTEVTVGQYRLCVDAGVCDTPKTGNLYTWSGSPNGREAHPVNGVNWAQARTFALWVGGDLPSESEWEFAARSGGEQVEFPWGDAGPSCSRARYNSCGDGPTAVCSRVDGHTMSGLCDMGGNVWEWVLDEYAATYDGAPSDGGPRCSDPSCSQDAPVRIHRGGGWISAGSSLRVANRADEDSLFRNNDLGFRVRRSPP